MRLLITRPEKQAKNTELKLTGLGHTCFIEPLLVIEQTNIQQSADKYDGFIVTSSNAISGLENATLNKSLPVITTGENTAKELRKFGMVDVISVDGSALDVARQIPAWIAEKNMPANWQLLYPCAEEVAHDINTLLQETGVQGGTLHKWPVYKARPIERFSQRTLNRLLAHEFDGVLLYSPRTAGIFAALIQSLPETMTVLTCYCLSQQIAEKLPYDLRKTALVANKPNEESLFKLLSEV